MGVPPIKKIQPHSARANSNKQGFERALSLFKAAAHRVPAYKDFLKKARIKADTVVTETDFAQIPHVSKTNYISKYDLRDLSWDGAFSSVKYMSSSSGSTGEPFYWPRGNDQDVVVNLMFQELYQNIFKTTDTNTLCVNSFALGTWIAGLEMYNATNWTADRNNSIVTITPGIDQELAIKEIERFGSSFERIILSGYPPFVKDILELGKHLGIAWNKWDICLLTGGESFTEAWRDHILELIGKQGDVSAFINMFGMAETGIVGHETPKSILLRRVLQKQSQQKNRSTHDLDQVLALYQYYPIARYYEALEDGSLILTTNAGLPLIRYDTRDQGGILDSKGIFNEFEDE